jgi:hypothetical protein
MDQLSPQGQNLLVGLKAKAEAFMAVRKTFGLGTTDTNISTLRGLLPGSKTGNSKIARALNSKADNYLDSLLANPMVRPFIQATEETPPSGPAKAKAAGAGAAAPKVTHKYNPATGKIEAVP